MFHTTPEIITKSRTGFRIAILLIGFSLPVFFLSCYDSNLIHFNIPQGSAEQTLLIFSEQSKTEIIFDLKSDVITHSIHGKMHRLDALEAMIKDTSLIYEVHQESGAIGIMERVDEVISNI